MDIRVQYAKSRLLDLFLCTPRQPGGSKSRPDGGRRTLLGEAIAEAPLRQVIEEGTREGGQGHMTLLEWLNGGSAPQCLSFALLPAAGDPPMRLGISSGDQLLTQGRIVWLLRNTAGGGRAPVSKQEQTAVGEIVCNVIDCGPNDGRLRGAIVFQEMMLREVYAPLLNAQQDWGCDVGGIQRETLQRQCALYSETLQGLFSDELRERLQGAAPADPAELTRLVPAAARTTQGAAVAAQNARTVRKLGDAVLEWHRIIAGVLAEVPSYRSASPENIAEHFGPYDELIYWRERLAKLEAIRLRMNQPGAKQGLVILGHVPAMATTVHAHKEVMSRVQEITVEAREQVKYLGSLEKFLEPLYTGPPSDVTTILPGLLNHIGLMYSISHYYSACRDETRRERMTCLFCLITNRMIVTCKHSISDGGKLWDQASDPSKLHVLLRKLEACKELRERAKAEYEATRKRLAARPLGPQFDFSDLHIFGRIDLFCRRVDRLIDVFQDFSQYRLLAVQNVDGMAPLVARFDEIWQDLRIATERGGGGEGGELLDYTHPGFDKEYNEFRRQIAELESSLQVFINSRFEHIMSTDFALALLRKFEIILQQDHLKQDLASKYMVIFHNYGLDLEHMQKSFDKHKTNPPVGRNVPPAAGAIQWVRLLLRRIEQPMQRFQNNRSIMSNLKESKKIVRSYNRLARLLVEFEQLWIEAWSSGVEVALCGLNATLLVRHNGRLLLNFDEQILRLTKEAKAMRLLGAPRIPLPAGAHTLLVQEDDLKRTHALLRTALRDYDTVSSRVGSVCKNVLAHVKEEIAEIIKPGETHLTWASLNVQGYLEKVRGAVDSFTVLIDKVVDITVNRIQSNLQFVATAKLVSLPEDMCFGLEQFLSMQEKYIRHQSEFMDARGREVERAVEDILDSVARHTPGREMGAEVAANFKTHYHRLMLKAILSGTTNSLVLIKNRSSARQIGRDFLVAEKPFFSVSVELAPPCVILNPSLEEIQMAVNNTATSVLRCSQGVNPWRGVLADSSFFEEVSRNKDIVKVVLLLTGGIHGLKRQVIDYLDCFQRFSFLWERDMEDEVAGLLASHADSPVAQLASAFDEALAAYVVAEQSVDGIAEVHNIGSLSLNTKPLRTALRKKAQAWKAALARGLHVRAQAELMVITNEMDEWKHLLAADISDSLSELRAMMEALQRVRDNEAVLDARLEPVTEMYEVLNRPQYNLPAIPQEEFERVSELRETWRRLRALAEKRSSQVRYLQHDFRREMLIAVQKYSTEVIVFRNDYEANGPTVRGIPPEEALMRLKKYSRLFEDKYRKWLSFVAGQELFGMPITRYPELAKTAREISHLDKLYTLYVTVRQRIQGYGDLLWDELVRGEAFQQIEEECRTFQQQCKALPKGLKEWEAFRECQSTIEDFSAVKPLLQCLAKEALQTRHWNELMDATKHSWKLEPDIFKLKHLLEANIVAHAETVEEISLKAEKEAQMDVLIRTKIEDVWKDLCFEFDEWRGRGELLLKGNTVSDIKDTLEESLMLLSGLNPRFLEPFKEKVRLWMQKLLAADKTLTLWVEVQHNWQALEAVFSGGDITKQMPAEAKKFHQIDKHWFKIISKAHEERNVIQFCYENEILSGLSQMRDGLETVQRQLAAYLESKKRCFPRFYFVADKELLEILSQASDPVAIQGYVKKLFDGVEGLRLEVVKPKETGQKPEVFVSTLFSPEGERLKLVEDVPCRGHVEEWLGALVLGMKRSVKLRVAVAASEVPGLRRGDQAPTCFDDKAFIDMLSRHPAQAVLLAIQMLWSMDVTDWIVASKQDRPQKARELGREDRKGEGRLNALLNTLISTTKEQLQPKDRTNVETLITVHIHQIEIWQRTILANKNSIRDTGAFEWLQQARVYFQSDKESAIVSICDTDTEYANEYLGVKERLVITPLTDRCYITLSQALSMKMGGAPAGPAGTGKTETTKDLGRMYGVYVVVFNCSDQMDRNAVGKIIKGLAQAGAWGCFDEFNRIELAVLSVVAQQIECILKALKEHRSDFRFVDDQLYPLRTGVGYFITMNPGYAGRQELPENLKILFRGVTMMVPDRKSIMKVKLAAAGYGSNEPLCEKFYQLYQICEQQLSKQRHYDFGLRNILSVLRSSGERLRKEMRARGGIGSPASPRGEDQQHVEERLFMRTLLDMNLSKLVKEDVSLFNDLLRDMFPGKEPDTKPDPELHRALRVAWSELGFLYQLQDGAPPIGLAGKVAQLHDTINVRHGVMVVGPAATGKSSVYEGLRRALTALEAGGERKRRYEMWRMFPKAVTSQEMFGRLDKTTGDWYDGIFSMLWKKATQLKHPVWICADGPVDAIWIENLNTVLDDNKLLTLAGGDRIQMTATMRCCFEVENLRNASPATVSRAGIVYISEGELGWEAVIRSRLNESGDDASGTETKLAQPLAQRLISLYRGIGSDGKSNGCGTEAVWKVFTKDCAGQAASPVSCLHLAVNSLTLVKALAREGAAVGRESSGWDAFTTERVWWFAVIWAFGGMLDDAGRPRFDEALRALSTTLPGKGREDSTVFEYRVDLIANDWQRWDSVVPSWTYPGDDNLRFSTLFIPTTDSTRLNFLLRCCFLEKRPVLLIGGSGTAKTLTMEHFLSALGHLKLGGQPVRGRDNFAYKKTNFSYATTPRLFYDCVEDIVEKRVGTRAYGPKRDKKVVLFIDDLGMPEVNKWGDQITNEIVRQVIDQGGYYSLEKDCEFKAIVDMGYWGAMSTPGGGKTDIPERLKSRFSCFCVPLPTDSSLHQIFGSIFHARFSGDAYTAPTRWVAERLAPLSIAFWRRITKKMLPTPSKFHYVFNLRDLSNVCQGMLKADRVVFTGTDDRPTAEPEVLLCRLWKHEATRVFSDRLNDEKDKEWFDKSVAECMVEHLAGNPWGNDLAARVPRASYFCDFLHGEAEVDPETGAELGPSRRHYRPIDSVGELREHLVRRLNEYNITEGKVRRLQLVLFDAAVKHVVRITRVLGTTRGSMLLVGVGGSGKQSLTRLSSFIMDYYTAQISAGKVTGVPQFLDEVRENYLMAGLQKPVTFLLTDSDIKQERFLEFLNNFISTGEVPGLWDKDPTLRDDATTRVLPLARKVYGVKTEQTREFLWNFFVGRVRDNLHLVLCFSPVGEQFRRRAREFPALVNTCVIDWFFPWPPEALRDVANAEMEGFEIDAGGESGGVVKMRESLLSVMTQVHLLMLKETDEYFQSFRRTVHATPKSYLSFLQTYKGVYAEKQRSIRASSSKIERGLSKLEDAGRMIGEMRVQMQEQEKVLSDRKGQIAEQLIDVKAATAQAEVKAAEVGKVRDELSRDEAVVQEQKDEASTELQAALPALEDARAAARDIQPGDLKELQASSNNPASLTRVVLDGVLILFHCSVLHPVSRSESLTYKKRMIGPNGFIEPSWDLKGLDAKFSAPPYGGGGRKFIANTDCVKMILDFTDRRKDQINEETCEFLDPYLRLECFRGEDANEVSKALAGLCKWVRAMHRYIKIARIVEPKMMRVREMQAALHAAQAKLRAKQTELAAVNAEKQRQQEDLRAKEDEQNRMEREAWETARRTHRANELIASLGGERERWVSDAERHNAEIRRLSGDAAIGCAFVSYCGPYNAAFRARLLGDRLPRLCQGTNLPHTAGSTVRQLVALLADEQQVADWQMEGLPADDHSVQNAIIITRSLAIDPPKYSLLIDPQGQGLKWLKRAQFPLRVPEALEGEEGGQPSVLVSTFGERSLHRQLAQQLSEGGTLIIEDAGEELDSLLDPVLEHNVQRRARRPFIALQSENGGEDNVDYNENFRLFITTRLPNPSFAPELFAKACVIDFTVTAKGLEQQLLNEVIARERKELGEERRRLMANMNENVRLLSELEDKLLTQLSSSDTSLIDDEDLVLTLEENKRRSGELREKQQNADEARRRIDTASAEYQPVAERGSVLYFLIVEVSQVNPMYQTSLTQFHGLFHGAMRDSPESSSAQRRIEAIVATLTRSVFGYVDRGLFARHKPLWGLLMACRVQQRAGHLSVAGFQTLLKGGAALNRDAVRPKPVAWLTDRAWLDVIAASNNLVQQKCWVSLPDNLTHNEQQWKLWCDHDTPETVPAPMDDLGPFERLLLVRLLRSDRLLPAARLFVASVLGQYYTESPAIDLGEIELQGGPLTPLIFLLSPGSDPTQMIHAMAKKRRRVVRDVSMGEGQDALATALVNQAHEQGDWALLQNCHLGLGFLESLEKSLASQAGEQSAEVSHVAVHSDARIWITAEPVPRFPIGLLQMSIKLTNEPPAGIRAGLKRTFAAGSGAVSQEMLESFRRHEWRPLLFALAFMHSLLQERRKFGAIGFCVPYEFNTGDLSASVIFLNNHFMQKGDDARNERAANQISYDTVRFMVAQIQYGGRVTDSKDAILLGTIAEHLLSPAVTEAGFQFAAGYRLPVFEEMIRYREFLDDPEEYPDTDSPEVFGLHANADIAYRTLTAERLLSVLVGIQPKQSASAGETSREERVDQEAASFERTLPKGWTKEQLQDAQRRLGRVAAGKNVSQLFLPLTIHCIQEATRLTTAIHKVRETLAGLRLALAGQGALSPPLHAAMESIADAQVPSEWLAVTWMTPQIGQWWAHLLRRHAQLSSWIVEDRPAKYWLAGFYNPQGFLTCVAQEVTRSRMTQGGDTWALADAVLRTEVTKHEDFDIERPPSEGGVYICGLHLECAAWDRVRQRIRDPQPRAPPFRMPLIHVTAENGRRRRREERKVFSCPVYKHADRTDINWVFDCSLGLADSDQSQTWIRRGVCLLTSVD
eukprot:Hpha_TRINITY_DN12121_c2_g2::TRINITY_DN12121_c2_g2_i1::g.81783::m.81783/K10408/DNAH; dynein heavy chain, axonemal